jgi:hypothetical protein
MDMVYLKVQEILHMKDIGKMIVNIQLELKFGKIILFIKVIFHMEKKMVLEVIFGLIKVIIKENGKII